VLAVAGWVGYLVHAATRLPDWYDADAVVDAADPELAPSGWLVVPDEEAAESEGEAGSSAPKPAKRRQLRNFHLRTAAGNQATRDAIRASRATYEDGRLDAGVVINVSRIDRSKLKKDDREFYERALEAFPRLKGRDVYIGIEDQPTARGGYLQLGPDTRVRVGKLDYSLRKVARKLGLSEAKVRRQIDQELVRLEVTDPDAPPPADELKAPAQEDLP
jgi:hypothetical protein